MNSPHAPGNLDCVTNLKKVFLPPFETAYQRAAGPAQFHVAARRVGAGNPWHQQQLWQEQRATESRAGCTHWACGWVSRQVGCGRELGLGKNHRVLRRQYLPWTQSESDWLSGFVFSLWLWSCRPVSLCEAGSGSDLGARAEQDMRACRWCCTQVREAVFLMCSCTAG